MLLNVSDVAIGCSFQFSVHTTLFEQSEGRDFFILKNVFSFLFHTLPTIAVSIGVLLFVE